MTARNPVGPAPADPALTLTPAAEKFIGRLLRFDGSPGSGLRLRVSPGGCAGLSAEFSVEPACAADERPVRLNGVILFLGAESRLLLDGATIDFAETPTSAGLVFHRPDHACGCASTAGAA